MSATAQLIDTTQTTIFEVHLSQIDRLLVPNPENSRPPTQSSKYRPQYHPSIYSSLIGISLSSHHNSTHLVDHIHSRTVANHYYVTLVTTSLKAKYVLSISIRPFFCDIAQVKAITYATELTTEISAILGVLRVSFSAYRNSASKPVCRPWSSSVC